MQLKNRQIVYTRSILEAFAHMLKPRRRVHSSIKFRHKTKLGGFASSISKL